MRIPRANPPEILKIFVKFQKSLAAGERLRRECLIHSLTRSVSFEVAHYGPGSGLQISFLPINPPQTSIERRHSNSRCTPFAATKMKFEDLTPVGTSWSAAARRSPPFSWNDDDDCQEGGDDSAEVAAAVLQL